MEQIIVYLLPLFVLVDVILLVWGLRLVRHQPGLLTGVILALLLASILDNSILSLGLVFGQSPDLENLNRFRYLLNALLTPLLIWVSFKIAHESGPSGLPSLGLR